MKITLEHRGTIATIEIEGIETCTDVVKSMVKPALLVLGFHPDTVDDALNINENTDENTVEDAFNINEDINNK